MRRAPPLLEEFVERTGLAPVDARTLLAKFGLGAGQVGRAGVDALAGRAHAGAPRGASGARRQPARPRRADQPPRPRGRRAARGRRSRTGTARSSSSPTTGASWRRSRRRGSCGSADTCAAASPLPWRAAHGRPEAKDLEVPPRQAPRPARHRRAARLDRASNCGSPKQSHRVCPTCKTYRGREIKPLRAPAP